MAILNTDNLISNLSYTEKDFQVIYPALLDLVKKLTSKWDPSASNESDPGVLLLKLNAIIADKLNYNIDKNVLECFPVSVTQEQNAHQLFEQLGYYMHWYKAAITNVTLRYIGDPVTNEAGEIITKLYTVPKFTMVTDNDNTVVYTLIATGNLATDGTPITLPALQGVAKEFTINNDALITVSSLDSNNRLYFDSNTVAENGIFIRNADSDNYSNWIKKDNLLIEEVSTANTFYKFGLSQDLNTSYIEFPENAEDLIQEGIYITYIDTNGAEGNIATNVLNKFYDNLVVIDGEEYITLGTSDVAVNNYVVGALGANPESIDDAYINYKKVVGTFDTLITLRDYMNVIKRSDYVSNAVVSDRTTDIQVAYKIMSKPNAIDTELVELENRQPYDVIAEFDGKDFKTNEYIYEPNPKLNYYDTKTGQCYRAILNTTKEDNTLVETVTHQYYKSDPVEAPALTAFELKSYILSATAVMKTATDYNTTFELNTDSSVQSVIEAELDDYRCVQHNFVDLLPNKICIIKNKYPINCKIIPQYALTTAQRDEILINIQQALYNGLNSSKIEFGEEIAYDMIYNLISEADPRIKAIALEPLLYTPYVVYLKSNSVDAPDVYDLVEEDLSEYITKLDEATNLTYKIDWDNIINQFRTEIYAKSVLAGKTQFFIPDTTFNYSLEQNCCLAESDIGLIKTELEIPFDASTDWQYTLRENESIQAFAPNLIETESFSTNVKFEYHLNNNVLSGTSYMLKENEYIIFYWMPTDSDKNLYTYRYAVYGKGAIIKPTFNLTKSIDETTDLIGASLINKCQLVTVNSQSYLYATGDTIYDSGDSSLEAQIEAISGTRWADNILSDNKIIYILLKNSIALDSSLYSCYWILNKDINGKYVLFDENTTERILASGEYFIYTTNTSSEMFILGAGTHIKRMLDDDEPPVSMTCPVMDYSTIVAEGLFALTDRWIGINKSSKLLVTEMQYFALNEGAIVKITPKDATSVQIDSYTESEGVKYEHNIKSKVPADTYYKLQKNEYIIFYKQNLDSKITDYNYTVYGQGTIIKCTKELAENDITPSDLKNSVLTKLVTEQTVYKKQDLTSDEDTDKPVKYTDRSYWTATGLLSEVAGNDISAVASMNTLDFNIEIGGTNIPEISKITLSSDSSKAAALAYCNIAYKNSISEAGWTVLPNISLDDISYSWQGSTILKLNTASTIPQELREGQKLTIYKYDFDKKQVIKEKPADYSDKQWEIMQPIEIDPSNTEKYSDRTYILTSRDFSETSSSISTIAYDTSNKPQAIELYAYLNTPKVEGVHTDAASDNTVFELNNISKQYNMKEVGFKLPAGSYILPVSHAINPDLLKNLSFNLRVPIDSKSDELAGYYKVRDIQYNESYGDYVFTLNPYKIKPESRVPAGNVYAKNDSYYPKNGYSDNFYYRYLGTNTYLNLKLWNQYTAEHTKLALKETTIRVEVPVESTVYKYGKKENLSIVDNTITYSETTDWIITKAVSECPFEIGNDSNTFITGINGDFEAVYYVEQANLAGSTKTLMVKPYKIKDIATPEIRESDENYIIQAIEGYTIYCGPYSLLDVNSENKIITKESINGTVVTKTQPFDVSDNYFILENGTYYKVTKIDSQLVGEGENIKTEWVFTTKPLDVYIIHSQEIIIENLPTNTELSFSSTIWNYGNESLLEANLTNTGINGTAITQLENWDLNATNNYPWVDLGSNYFTVGLKNDPKSFYKIQNATYDIKDPSAIKWIIELREYTTTGNPESWIDIAEKSEILEFNVGTELDYGNIKSLSVKPDNTMDAITVKYTLKSDNTELPFIGKDYFILLRDAENKIKYYVVDNFLVEDSKFKFSVREYVVVPGTKESTDKIFESTDPNAYPDKDFKEDESGKEFYYEKIDTIMHVWTKYEVIPAYIEADEDEILIKTKDDLGKTCGYGSFDNLYIDENNKIASKNVINYWEPEEKPDKVAEIITDLTTKNTFIGGTATTQALASMGDVTITNLNKPGKYYLKVDIPENNLSKDQYLSIVLKVTLAEAAVEDTPSISVHMYPIYKYTKPENLSSNTAWNNEIYEKVYEKIRLLDCNNKFNYTYVVKDDEKIVDPLDPKSFLDLNHPYNNYTICQINTATLASNLQVTNIVK